VASRPLPMQLVAVKWVSCSGFTGINPDADVLYR